MHATRHGCRQAGIRRKIRVVVAKPGLDGHDRGAKIIARALRDAGMEVIYTGLHQTPEQIAETVIQEDADAVGLSILSGRPHDAGARGSSSCSTEQGADDVVVIVGGTIPADDIPELKQARRVPRSSPRAPRPQEIVDFVRNAVAGLRPSDLRQSLKPVVPFAVGTRPCARTENLGGL